MVLSSGAYSHGDATIRSAHASFREAVRRDPENNVYRQGALDAALAMKESATLQGKLKKLLHWKKVKVLLLSPRVPIKAGL